MFLGNEFVHWELRFPEQWEELFWVIRDDFVGVGSGVDGNVKRYTFVNEAPSIKDSWDALFFCRRIPTK